MSSEQELAIQRAVEETLRLVVNVHEAVLYMFAKQRPRHNLEANKRLIIQFMVATGRWLCPCCLKTPIIGNDNLLKSAVFHHWSGPSDNSIENLWPMDGACHVTLHKRLQVRQSKEIRFKAFQQDLHEWLEHQVPYGVSGEQEVLFQELPKSLKVG